MNNPSITKSQQTIVFSTLLLAWFVVNILQSVFTEINADEAYYALYGQHLEWGYFDHPPMVGLMTRLSSLLFDGNLGVRFMTVIMQLACLLLTWGTINKANRTLQNTYIFFTVAFASVMFSAYGFITTPDAPLLLFTSLFLFGYKKFLASMDWYAVIILIIASAGLAYSKYQGILLIALVVLSNLKLIKTVKFWFIVIVSLVLILPHIYWQYINDFPSIKYHVVSRSSGFKWGYLFEYLPNQLATFNPFVLGAVIYAMYKHKATEDFEKALYFIIIGFIAFFGITAFRGHVEPHWTVAASVAMMILLVNKSSTDIPFAKYIRKFVFGSIVLLLIARVLICTTLLPERIQFHSKQQKYLATQEIAGNRPVIYSGSFQNPSLYHYFTGKNSTVISSLMSRITQFDLWKFQQQYQGKPAYIVMHIDGKSQTYTSKSGLIIEGYFVNRLQTTDHIKIDFETTTRLQQSQVAVMELMITNPSNVDFEMNHQELPARIEVVWINNQDIICTPCQITKQIDIIKAHQTIKTAIRFVVPKIDINKYKLGVCLSSDFGPSINSIFSPIEKH